MKKIITIALMAIATLLAACGKPEEPVTFDRLEEMRQIAKSNSEFNAQMYKAQNPRFTADFSIVSRSDDTQNSKCPQGDGWAELSIMKVDGKTIDKTVLMCSTYSASVGCYRKEDFDKNPNLAQQNGRCGTDVPYPLPALKK
jgi:major membrane immunogen (membrane-anchored lipoprotein)